MCPADPRRIIFGANKNKVIVHDLAPDAAEAVLHKLQFPCFVVHEHDVTFAELADLERLPGADGHHQDLDAARPCKYRQEVAE